jgi:predicted RNA binding protein YcfA (HicA-like mRNA interferase family)
MKVKDVLKLAKSDGWVDVTRRGSHRQLTHQTKQETINTVWVEK